MTPRLVVLVLVTLPLGGCLWDSNQTLLEFVTGQKLVLVKTPPPAPPPKQETAAKPEAPAPAPEETKSETAAKPAQPREKAPEQASITAKAASPAAPGNVLVADRPPQPPAVERPPRAVPRPAVKVDASADVPAGDRKPMMKLPLPSQTMPRGQTPAEKSWQEKMAKRDRKKVALAPPAAGGGPTEPTP